MDWNCHEGDLGRPEILPEAMTACPEVVKCLSGAGRKELQQAAPLQPGWLISHDPTLLLLGWKHSRVALRAPILAGTKANGPLGMAARSIS